MASRVERARSVNILGGLLAWTMEFSKLNASLEKSWSFIYFFWNTVTFSDFFGSPWVALATDALVVLGLLPDLGNF